MTKNITAKYFNFFIILSIFTILTTLSGCGYHFVKSAPNSNPIKIQLKTDQPYSQFTGILISKLKSSKVTIQDNKKPDTDFFVLIGPLENTHQITNLSGNSLAGTYTDSYSVTITIINLKSKKPDNNKKTQTITLTSDGSYNSNSTQELSQASQNADIREKAYQDLSQKIVNQLNIIYQDKT